MLLSPTSSRLPEGTVITHGKARQMLATYKELHTPATPEDVPEPPATPETPATTPRTAHTAKPSTTTPAPAPAQLSKPQTFNPTNENIDWAKWSWNPVTGCLHNCVYCYARDIAERLYPEKFAPTFHPERLSAPHHTKVPAKAASDVGYRNVFVCSMADLFGKWVPQEWIDAVTGGGRAAPQWNFLFLTKFPQRLETIDWPKNSWVGTTVDEQYRVTIAEKAFRNVNAPVKWLSCEPLRERLTFSSLDMFDWVVVGGQSQSTQAPAFQPPWEWVEHLWQQARASGCLLYWKPNLHTRPQEFPTGRRGHRCLTTLLTTHDAAAYLHVSPRTLEKWRLRRRPALPQISAQDRVYARATLTRGWRRRRARPPVTPGRYRRPRHTLPFAHRWRTAGVAGEILRRHLMQTCTVCGFWYPGCRDRPPRHL